MHASNLVRRYPKFGILLYKRSKKTFFQNYRDQLNNVPVYFKKLSEVHVYYKVT